MRLPLDAQICSAYAASLHEFALSAFCVFWICDSRASLSPRCHAPLPHSHSATVWCACKGSNLHSLVSLPQCHKPISGFFSVSPPTVHHSAPFQQAISEMGSIDIQNVIGDQCKRDSKAASSRQGGLPTLLSMLRGKRRRHGGGLATTLLCSLPAGSPARWPASQLDLPEQTSIVVPNPGILPVQKC